MRVTVLKIFALFVSLLALSSFVSSLSVRAAGESPDVWVPSYQPAGVTRYQDYPDGIYYVRAKTKDTYGNTSAFSGSFQVELTYPPLTASCYVSPPSGFYTVNPLSPYPHEHTWAIAPGSVTGGNRQYTYEWSGTDGLEGSGTLVSARGASTTKSYTTAGPAGKEFKTGSVRITSAGRSADFPCGSTEVTGLAEILAGAPVPTPSPSMVGQGATTFSAVISNATGTAATPPNFPNLFQIFPSRAYETGIATATGPGSGPMMTIPGPSASLGIGEETNISESYTFSNDDISTYGTTFYVRACGNTDIGSFSYTNPNDGSTQYIYYAVPNTSFREAYWDNNCSGYTEFTVYPRLVIACSSAHSGLPDTAVDPDDNYSSKTFTWTHTPATGGNGGPYTYSSWLGGPVVVGNLNSLSGNGVSTQKKYSTIGVKTAAITVSVMGNTFQSTTPPCPVTVLPIADLTATTSPTITPSSNVAGADGMVGRPVTFSGSVANAGSEATGRTTSTTTLTSFPNMFQVAYGTGCATNFGTDCTILENVGATPAGSMNLNVGSSLAVSAPYTFTDNVEKDYYVRLCANSRFDHPFDTWLGYTTLEANPGNNCSTPQRIHIYRALAVSCSVTSGLGSGRTDGFVNDTVFNWTRGSVDGGDFPVKGNSAYTYLWNGTGGLSGTNVSTSTIYSTIGTKDAALTLTSMNYSITQPCSNSAIVTARPDLTANSVTPTSAYTGVAKTFTASIHNDNVSTGLGTNGTGFDNLFQRATDVNGANATDIGTWRRTSALASGGVVDASLSYTFSAPGTYYLRVCADKRNRTTYPNDTVGEITPELDEGNNCGGWTEVTVTNPPPLYTACSVSPPTSGPSPTSFTWKINKNQDNTFVTVGGNGSYTYSWQGTDGLSGSGSSKSKSYSTVGSKYATTTVTSTIDGTPVSQTFPCDNSASIVVYKCTNLPAHAEGYPAPDNTGLLTGDIAYTHGENPPGTESNTATKCEFKCESGYKWDGSSCAPLPDLTATLDSPSSAPAAAILALGNITNEFTATILNAHGPTPAGAGFTNLFQRASQNPDVYPTTPVSDIDTFSIVALPGMPALPIGGTAGGALNFTFPSFTPITSASGGLHRSGLASVVLALDYTAPAQNTYWLRVCADENLSRVGSIEESNEGNNCSGWKKIDPPPNQVPNAPTISGPTTGTPSTPYPYTFTATDPDGDTLHYQIDWNNNGTVEQTLPSATTYVSSGMSQKQANNWASEGEKTFQARTVDVRGGTSAWTPYTVTLACASGTVWDGSACALPVIYTLTLNSAGTGTGTVTGAGAYNSQTNGVQTLVTATATPSVGSVFLSWGGVGNASDCTGTNASISVIMNANKTCTANFGLITSSLSLSSSAPVLLTTIDYGQTTRLYYSSANIRNPASCSIRNNVNSTIRSATANVTNYSTGDLSAPLVRPPVPDRDTTFTLVCTGATNKDVMVYVAAGTIATSTQADSSCAISAGSGSCSVNLTWSSVHFTSPIITNGTASPYTAANGTAPVTVRKGGDTFTIKNGTYLHSSVYITAECATNTSWNGSVGKCLALPYAYAGPDREITLPTDLPEVTIPTDVADASSPNGTIASTVWTNPAGPGTLRTTANGGITDGDTLTPRFSGLVGGTYTFRLTVTDSAGMTKSDEMTVVVRQKYTLTVGTAGNGSGTVTGAGSYLTGTAVAISATPNAGSVFNGWTGNVDCTDYLVTMNADKTCTANFGLITSSLSASPSTINYSQSTTLTYSSENIRGNPASCSIDNGVGIVTANVTNAISTAPTQDTTYTLSCTGTAATTTTVLVAAGQFVHNATPPSCTIARGSSSCNVNLTWTSVHFDTPSSPIIVNSAGDSLYTGIENGTNKPVIVKRGGDTFTIKNGDFPHDSISGVGGAVGVRADCVSGDVWNGTACYGPLTVNAGPDRTVEYPANVTILTDAASASSPNGAVTSMVWTKTSGPNNPTITNGDTLTPTFSGLVEGTYDFRLSATDNVGVTGSSMMRVVVYKTYVLAVNKIGNGSVTGAGSYITGTVVTVSATPDTGSVFLNWSGNCTGTNASFSVTMNAAKTCTATFGAISATLSASPTLVDYGQSSILTYTLANVSGCSINNGATPSSVAGASGTRSVIPTGDTTYTLSCTGISDTATVQVASGRIDPSTPADLSCTIPINSGTCSVNLTWTSVHFSTPTSPIIVNSAGDSLYTGIENGTAKPAIVKYGGDTFTIKNGSVSHYTTNTIGATCATGSAWKVSKGKCLAVPIANAGSDRTITLPVNSVTISGASASSDNGAITSIVWTNPAGPGTLRTVANGGIIVNNSNLYAPTFSGLVEGSYTFRLTVTDSAGESQTDDMTVIVYKTYVLTVNKIGNGSVTGGGTYNSGTVVTVSATPDAGSVFINWSGNCTGSNTSTSVTVNADKTCTSNFSLITSSLSASRTLIDYGQTTSLIYSSENIVNPASCSITRYNRDNTINNPSPNPFASLTVNNAPYSATTPPDTPTQDATYKLSCTGATDKTVNVDVAAGNISASAPLCTIPAGSSTCSINLTWSSVHFNTPSSPIITNGAGNSLYTGIETDTRPATVKYLGDTFTIKNGSVSHYSVNVGATCANGSEWKTYALKCLAVPIANAGPDRAITLPTTSSVDISGASASSANGPITSIQWTNTGSPTGSAVPTISNNGTLTPRFSGLVEGRYDFHLKVTDNTGEIDEDDMLVAVSERYTLTLTVSPIVTVRANPAATSSGTVSGGGTYNSRTANGDRTVVPLIATPSYVSVLENWSGDPDCTDGSVTMDADKACVAKFTLGVCSNPTQIVTGIACDPVVRNGLNVPAISGDVTREQTKALFPVCTFDPVVTIFNSTYVSDTCVYPSATAYTVTSSKSSHGSMSPLGNTVVSAGALATFNLSPETDYIPTISGTCPTGALTGSGTSYTYTTGAITNNCTVVATFNIPTYTLGITFAGNGSGNVSSSPTGINCTSSCSSQFSLNTVVTLTASSTVGQFAGWSGGICSGTGTCSVTMDTGKNVTATFSLGSCSAPLSRDITVACDLNARGLAATSGDVTRRIEKNVFPNCTEKPSVYVSDTCVYPPTPYTVTASGGSNGLILPLGNTTVTEGNTATFTVSPNTGYSATIGGTCPAGTRSGTQYTTGAIRNDCTVVATFTWVDVDTCGTGSGSTPQSSEPTGTAACIVGTYANAPVDTTFLWKWSCGAVTNCSAPKYGCITPTDTNYNPADPPNNYRCALTCANGATNYPTCIVPVVLPDLTASLVAPTTISSGVAATYTPTISNANAPVGVGFKNLIQRASDANGTDAYVVGTYESSALLAGHAERRALQLSIPSALVPPEAPPLFDSTLISSFVIPGGITTSRPLSAPGGIAAVLLAQGSSGGTSYMRVCADKDSSGDSGSVPESNENNNCSDWQPVNSEAACDANATKKCISEANACGVTNDSGTTQCDGSCSSPKPSDASCPPTKPEISALWKGSVYYGPAEHPSAPGYEALGYQLNARSTSPSGANLYYSFEWAEDLEHPTATAWTGNNGWGTVTHYANSSPGTYYFQAWALIRDPIDSNNFISSEPTGWLPVTLTVPEAPHVTCVGSPGNPYIGQPVTWSSTVTGGVGSYSYSWSGGPSETGNPNSLSGTASSIIKSYTSAGIKTATVEVTDTVSLLTSSATCDTGTFQPNGPPSVNTGGKGVSVGACTATLTANPDQVSVGDMTYLTWSVTGGSVCASSCVGGSADCTIDTCGFATGGAISGSNVPANKLPVNNPTPYALTCTAGTYGPPPQANASVKVTPPQPKVFLCGETCTSGGGGGSSVTGGSVLVDLAKPDNVTITWEPPPSRTCAQFPSCSITKNGVAWRSNLACSGTVTDTATAQTTYGVDCKTPSNVHAVRSILVNVLLNYKEF